MRLLMGLLITIAVASAERLNINLCFWPTYQYIAVEGTRDLAKKFKAELLGVPEGLHYKTLIVVINNYI